ncbi:MAG: mannose-6-phosphate isomerase, class I [Propionibacteriaceae bacterium]|nr:mannose-6-phosphate isomerase, class I [Propionibacteriaceae bacterium]
MQHLRGTLIHYPWGTFDTIHELLGTEPDGRPLAEYWLGAHTLAPSPIDNTTLDKAVAERPEWLGTASVDAFGPQLPFLMKILSARHPLSLQAHPSRAAAEEGFAAEEAAGVPLTSPQRVYKDAWPKPEIMVALTPFHTLCGFRDPMETIALFEALGGGPQIERIVSPLRTRAGEVGLQEIFLKVLALSEQETDLVDAVLAAAITHRDAEGAVGVFARTALELDDVFPSDPGILAALLMNRVELEPGQALYTPAGVMHAHLRGTGIEVMASSDNVLRGGLTSKHIAVDELVRVVDFTWNDPEVIDGTETTPGVWDYPTHCREFDIVRLEVGPGSALSLPEPEGARIALVTRGSLSLSDDERTLELAQGDSVFIPAGNPPITASGNAQVFLASPGTLGPI